MSINRSPKVYKRRVEGRGEGHFTTSRSTEHVSSRINQQINQQEVSLVEAAMEAALLRVVIYFFALANFACSLEHAKRTRSCAQFPTHMQLFCYRVEKFWGSIAFPDPRNTVEDVQEVDRNNVVVGNVVQNNKLKDTGKLRYVEQTFKWISK